MSVISEEELQEIVEVVWMTVFELPVDHGEDVELGFADNLTSRIAITGVWQGVVMVRASEQFLTHAAGIMFSCSLEDVTNMDRNDALSELTNMLGGTVKCLLPELCDLSLPTILDTDSDDGHDHEWVNFTCEGSALAVAVTKTGAGVEKAA